MAKKNQDTGKKEVQINNESSALEQQIMTAWKDGVQEDQEENRNEFVDREDFKVEMKDITLFIKTLLVNSAENHKEIARKLVEAYNRIELRVQASDAGLTVDEVAEKTKEAILAYAKIEFDFRDNRALEYVRLGCNEGVLELNLPISSLIEISRLPLAEFSQLLKMFDIEQLSRMSFREIKALTSSLNPKKRNRKKVASSKSITVQSAASIQNTGSDNVSLISKDTSLALRQFIHIFESIHANMTVLEVPIEHSAELERIGKWCLAACKLMDKAA